MPKNQQEDPKTKKCECGSNCCCNHKGGGGCSDNCKCRSHRSGTVDSKQSES